MSVSFAPTSAADLPAHLQKYITQQDYSRYTPQDHAVWRNILRQLYSFMVEHAHPAYAEGLKKSGIELDRIPHIETISENLRKFGWRAVAVSGFIPPAAFMELQAFGFLPIACDMRTLEHLTYTPAPDIVHEAAGHAPILIDPEFAHYLKRYAKIAKNAIISSEDIAMYEAIRTLSDLKEHPSSTAEEITKAEEKLAHLSKNISHVSEAALLGRMNWWTAEYGLIGDINNPKIFGAGLLSSVAEARNCLSPEVKKLPLSIDCINYSYDITEQQPQLFVTPDFATLNKVLEQLAEKMAFRTGGVSALEKALQAKNVNTVELDSGIQISGELSRVILGRQIGTEKEVAYLNFKGPVQLSHMAFELDDHSSERHPQGFGSPMGLIAGAQKNLARMSDSEFAALGVKIGHACDLKFNSGVSLSGVPRKILRAADGKTLVITFTDALVQYQNEVLFKPEWGEYDMAIGSKVVSVFGGPADREAYIAEHDFEVKRVPLKEMTDEVQTKNSIYQLLSDMRAMKVAPDSASKDRIALNLRNIFELVHANFPNDWLLPLEIFELSLKFNLEDVSSLSLGCLEEMKSAAPELSRTIDNGIRLAAKI